MNSFLAQIRPALVSTLVLALVCCGLYPLAVWGLGQALFPDRANGSLLREATQACTAGGAGQRMPDATSVLSG